jgi:hypothetical protein
MPTTMRLMMNVTHNVINMSKRVNSTPQGMMID